MLTYSYTARDPKTGKKVKSEIIAANQSNAAQQIAGQGLVLLDLNTMEHSQGISDRFDRIKSKDRIVFSRQLSTLISAGLPLIQSLSMIKNQTKSKKFKAVIAKVISDVEGGSTLADALAAHPSVFSEVYVSLVAGGEVSGTLDKVLESQANQQEKDAETVSKLRGALIYPALIIVVLIAVVAFLLTSVLPRVEELYASLPGVELPFLTKLLIAVSNGMIKYWWLIILIIIISVVFGVRWSHTKTGRLAVDKLKITIWGFSALFMAAYMARFSRTASTLLASGVPMIKALHTTANAVGNRHIEASILNATTLVEGGKPLSEALAKDTNFPELVPSMVRIGEQSGSLSDMLAKLADYYEKELDGRLKSITTIVEPILMVVVGIMALIVVAAVLLPIYSLAGKNLIPR